MASEKSKKLFGTDGIRGKAGEYPLDERTVERIGVSLVENLTAELNRSPRLLIGRRRVHCQVGKATTELGIQQIGPKQPAGRGAEHRTVEPLRARHRWIGKSLIACNKAALQRRRERQRVERIHQRDKGVDDDDRKHRRAGGKAKETAPGGPGVRTGSR